MHISRTCHPILIKALQFIQILGFLRQDVIIRCKQYSKDILFIIKFHLSGFIQRLTQQNTSTILLSNLHFFIEKLEAGKHHLGQRPVIFDILRSEGIQSIHTSHCNLTRGKTFNGTLIELTALQTVLIIIPVIVESIISVFCIDRRNYIHYTIGRSHPHIFIIIFYDTGNKYPRIVPRKRNYL